MIPVSTGPQGKIETGYIELTFLDQAKGSKKEITWTACTTSLCHYTAKRLPEQSGSLHFVWLAFEIISLRFQGCVVPQRGFL
jgi:hypothetical protein